MSKKKALILPPSILDTYPPISIVIPVLNGGKTIGRCIESIMNQDYPKQCTEVIVVDNDSTDDTARIAGEYEVVYLKETKRGASAARNNGMRHARGDIILFMDADCIADRNLLIEHARAHLYYKKHDPGVKAVGGGIEGENKNYWAVCDDFSSWFLYHPRLRPALVSVHSTANLSISRDILPLIDFFDENLDYAEDYVFCTCLIRKGFRIYFHPQARVKHINRTSLEEAVAHSRNWTKTQFLIREKGFVRRDFLRNELLIILYYFFPYLHSQFFEFFSDIWASKRYHIIFYFPFVIFIRLQFYYYELKEELRFLRHKKSIAKQRKKQLV